MASGATAEGNTVTFKAEGRDVKATLNGQSLVEKVEYLTTNSVVGDVPVERSVVIKFAVPAHDGGATFVEHAWQSDVAAEATTRAARRTLGEIRCSIFFVLILIIQVQFQMWRHCRSHLGCAGPK